jgi:hypothetical protein
MDTPAAHALPGAPFAAANGLTSKREMFCRVYVVCGNSAEAARQAGYAADSARQQGHRLLDDETIRARIEELWRHAEAARTTDRDLLFDKADRLFEAAMADKSFNAAARALALQARFAGFTGPAREREEVVPGRPGPVKRASLRRAAQEARRDDVAVAAAAEAPSPAAGDEQPKAIAPSTGPRPAPPSGEADCIAAAGPEAEAHDPAVDDTRLPSPEGGEGSGTSAVRGDPWAEASRIERQRRLAGLRCTLAEVRRREDLASRAALAARDAAEAAPAAA